MSRIVAIDFGRKRTGIAVTDPLQMIATALTTVATHEIWVFLDDYFKKEPVGKVIIGYPLQMNNQPSEAIRYINPFIKKFRKKYTNIPIETVDERFTSKIAQQTLIEAGAKKKIRQNKALIDSISATIILQTYLDSIRR